MKVDAMFYLRHLSALFYAMRRFNLRISVYFVRQRRRITEVPVACRQLTMWLAAIRCEITGL